MFSSPKTFIILGFLVLATSAVFLFSAFLGAINRPPVADVAKNETATQSLQNSENIGKNAFLKVPESGNGFFEQFFGSATPDKQTVPVLGEKSPEFTAYIPSPQEINDNVPVTSVIGPTPPAPVTVPLLELPTISDSEISINSAGASTLTEYVGYINDHSKEISFDYKKFDSTLKDDSDILFLPFALAEKAINDKNFSEIHNSFVVWQEFTSLKGKFFSSIPVTGDAIELSKKTLAFNKLVAELISKFFEVEKGNLSLQEFENYFNGFDVLATKENQKLLGQTGLSSLNYKDNFFSKIFRFLSFEKRALAISTGIPFGGMVGVVIPCVCDQSFWVFIGPPKPVSQGLLVSLILASTPPYYLYINIERIPHIGSWWLGTYLPVPKPCLTPPFCTPIGFGNPPILLGTSK